MLLLDGPGPLMLALALLYAAASALPGSTWLQSWVLKPADRSVDEIRLALKLLRLASGLVLAIVVAAAVLGARV